ncbi:uncharacterized protein, partial [Littorina saxatilis]|uniref:uncharacterized protein n=1 Tax=Littorina saxatilis TaxID=31220 RepID=UPI0038B514C7
MHIVNLQSICTLFAAMAGFNVHGSGPLITCDAGTFNVGEHASITCNFRVLITTTERPINMARYPSDARRGAIGTDVLLCRWSTEKKKYDCFIEMANYTFDDNLTDHLTVRIPSVSFEQAGLYMCFFVPSEGTDPHPCELRVQAKPARINTENTNTDKPEESQAVLPIVLPCVIVVLVGVCIAGLVLLMRRRRANSRVHRREAREMEDPMIPSEDHMHKIKALLGGFELQNSELQELMQVLDQEMSKGLNNETNIQADIKMFPTFVNLSPNVSGSEDMLVMDLNDKRLKVSLVTLQGQNASLNESKCYTIQEGVRRETVKQLFDFVADSTHDFVKFHRVPTKTLRLVLNIAFPCKHESIDKGYLVKWTKEVEFGEVDGTHLHILLQEALDRKRQTKK